MPGAGEPPTGITEEHEPQATETEVHHGNQFLKILRHGSWYFAASVLMPKARVKTAFFSGTQRVADLAEEFDVSLHAMSIRLRLLGLIEAPTRCRHQPPRTRRYAPSTSSLQTAGGLR